MQFWPMGQFKGPAVRAPIAAFSLLRVDCPTKSISSKASDEGVVKTFCGQRHLQTVVRELWNHCADYNNRLYNISIMQKCV